MFTRTLSPLASIQLFPGETTLDFVSLGASLIDPFPFFFLSINNLNEVQTFDFETEEITGVATIKYKYEGGVARKDEMTDPLITSPLLVMQDVIPPIAYLYPDDTNENASDHSHTSKSGKQEINYRSDLRLPVVQVDAEGNIPDPLILGGVHRYHLKANWHLFTNSIICDEISIFVRRRIKSGLTLAAYNFL